MAGKLKMARTRTIRPNHAGKIFERTKCQSSGIAFEILNDNLIEASSRVGSSVDWHCNR
jgi:hypothetical protein